VKNRSDTQATCQRSQSAHSNARQLSSYKLGDYLLTIALLLRSEIRTTSTETPEQVRQSRLRFSLLRERYTNAPGELIGLTNAFEIPKVED
jgi:hypothetical protein